jgi:F-type H+-transporting ATPase subunit epsilon
VAADSLTIELCSPDQPPVEFQADKVVLPGADGVMTVMPGHTLFLTTLTNGAAIVHQGDETHFFAIHGGFAEILNDKIVVLADMLEASDDIDAARAEAAMARAKGRIQKPEEDTSVEQAEAAMARSLARLQAKNGEFY